MKVYRAAKMYAAQQGLGEANVEATQPIAAPSAKAQAPPPVVSSTRKCSDVIDQGDEGHFPLLPFEEIRKMREKFEEVTGGEPEDSVRPTSDQLSALVARLKSGRAPYVDMALFGPYGERTSRLRRFSAQVWVDNELQTKMLMGPKNLEAWKQSWAVFRAAMIMVEAASPAALDRYSRGIERLMELHGDWPNLMIAEEKCRFERLDILADKFASSPPSGL